MSPFFGEIIPYTFLKHLPTPYTFKFFFLVYFQIITSRTYNESFPISFCPLVVPQPSNMPFKLVCLFSLYIHPSKLGFQFQTQQNYITSDFAFYFKDYRVNYFSFGGQEESYSIVIRVSVKSFDLELKFSW